MREALTFLSATVHELQKERGSACLFLGSNGKRFEKQLKQQFLETDKVFSALENSYKQWVSEKKIEGSASGKAGGFSGKERHAD